MIKVLHQGLYTSIQDLGRHEYQHLGVPVSGVMDVQAAFRANAILGNDENCAVMEITMLGPKLEFRCDTIISLVGASFSPRLNGMEIQNNLAINVCQGDILTFGILSKGYRTYLAVYDGFQSEVVMNSRSMYRGITKLPYLKKGDVLKINTKRHSMNKYSSIRFNDNYVLQNQIEVFKGPEFESLNESQIDLICNHLFTISKDNNRMAYQLNELVNNDLNDIITSLVIPGTVQLTPSGKLIVLMRDCQTTGGYPRILQLSESSINALAQKKIGNKIEFKLLNYNFN